MKTYAAFLLGLLLPPLLQADVLVNLDATSQPAGTLNPWPNTGTMGGGFTPVGTPQVVSATYGTTTVKALILTGTNYYLGPIAPASVTATTSPRTVEAWVYNPLLANEETIIAWGRRAGSPEGSNMSFNYGSSTWFGAVGHHGAAFDMGWYSSGAASPAVNVWRYLVYTYNGTTATVYVDGVQTNSKTVGLNTHALSTGGAGLKFVVGQQNEANGTNTNSGVFGSMHYGRIRVRNELMTPTDIANTFAAEAATFGRATPTVVSFTASPTVFLPGQKVTLSWTSTFTTSASINQGVGAVAAPSGSVDVFPTVGTTYTLTVATGAANATAQVTVTPFAPPALRHRWSFSEASGTAVNDSVGTAHGTIIGAGATRDGTKVTLPGGSPATQAYIDLPNRLISWRNEVTLEGWMTINGTQNWSRYFDFGTGTAGEITGVGGSASGTEYLIMTAQVGAAQGTKRLALRDNNVEQSVDLADATTNGQQFHFAVVYKADGNNGAPQVRYYKDGALIGSLNTTFRLQDIEDVNNWLGRSNWTGDNNTQGAYNEFRIWNAGLSTGSIADTAASGPDSMPQAPRIDVFTALPSATIYRGESVRLSYLLSELASLGLTSSIDQGVGALPANSGYVTVAPTTTTTYTLTSTNSAATRTATVTIAVLASAPIAANLTVTTNYETAAPVTLSATDPNTPLGSLAYSIVTPPAYGVLTGTGTARTYTPAVGYSGPDSFTYKANDGLSDSNIATVSITVYPPPVAPSDIVPSETAIFTDAITGTFIARLRPVDANPTDTHTLTLVAGTGGTHNGYFTVNGNQLISGRDFSGDVGQTISIRVRVTDSTGFTFEKVLTFPVQVPDLHVKINEVNFNSARNTQLSEFIELYNPFGTPVNIGGWHFTKGVDYTFPANTMIPANGYLVIAQEPATIQALYGVTALGPWVGGLSSDGDEIVLRDSAGVKIDGMEYGITSPWPVPPNGDGPTLELVNPNLDNDLGGHWRASTTSPAAVSYLTVGSAGWRYRKGTSEASAPLGAWRAEAFAEDASWLTGTMPIGLFKLNNNTSVAFNPESGVTLGTQLTDMASYSAPNFSVSYRSVFFRKTFTVAGAIPRALLLRVMHNDAAVVWINGVEVARFGFPSGSPSDPPFNTTNIYERGNDPWSELVLRDAASLLHAGTNTIAIQGFAKAPQLRAGSEDAATYNLFDFCVDAELKNVPELLGTPGAQNSVFVTNGAPAIRDVQHEPAAPKSFEAVTVTARVSDGQGVGSVQLAYQLCVAGSFIPATLPLTNAQLLANPDQSLPLNPAFELPANWTTIPMVDNGSVAGDIPGDGLFTARIPAQPHRTLVRYRITATDLASATVRVPGTDDPRKNYAYFSYNGVPAYVAGGQVYGAGVLDTLPVYHWITRASDFSSLLAYAGAEQFVNNADLNVLRARRFENFEGALVVGDQVVDHTVTRLRGGNSRYVGTGKRHFRFKFPKGTPLAAADERGNAYARPWEEMLFNKLFGNKGYYDWGLPYEAGGKLWSLLGIPIPESHWIQFRVVRGAAEAPDATNGDFWGLYQALELPEGKNFLKARDLPLGNFFKMSDWTQNGEMDERYQAAGAPDFGEDFDNIRYNIHQTASDAFIKTYVNMPLWYRYHAAQEAMRHYDIFVEPTGRHRVKNLLWYFQPTAGTNGLGNVWFMPYDWDASFGPNWNNGWDFVHNAIYDHNDIPDSPTWVLPKVSRTNTLQIEHRNAIRELRDLAWYRDGTGRGPFDDMVDDALATISAFWPADRARWPATGAQADHAGGAPYKAQDMKNFAFTGWTDPTGNNDPAVGAGGRAAYLDTISDTVDAGQLPATPTITYTGAGGNPVDGITLQSTAFSDPQGPATFAAMQWRIGAITDPAAPAHDPLAQRIYELTPVWESGDILTFAAGIQVPAAALRVGHTYRARVRHRDATGRWSHWSQPVQFTTTTANYLQVLKDNLMFSELMYRPAGPVGAEVTAGYLEGDFEYIELRNISDALTLDLTSVRFTKGIDFDFAGSAITSLLPGARVLIVKKIAAFNLRHGAGKPVAGAWDSLDSLNNGGEEVKLSFGAGAAIHQFTYDNAAPWPIQASVGGYSLVLKTPETRPAHALAANWRASYVPGGSPGVEDRTTFSEWAAANGVSAPLGDQDGDGIGNQLEYALRGNPNVRDTSILPVRALQPFTVLGVPGNYLTLSFRRVLGAEDLTYTTQWTTDLASWSTAGVLVSSTDHLDGTVTELWRSPFPMTGAKTFGRLEIVRP